MPPTAGEIFSASIILCTRNRADSLRRTLDALRSIRIPEGWTVELIIVDNGSTDDTPAVAASCAIPGITVCYVVESQDGKAFALNRGIEASTGSALVFLDDDIIPAADWLERICQPIRSGDADAVAGGIQIAPQLTRNWMRPLHRAMLANTETEHTQSPPLLVGGNMAFARKVLRDVPGYDTELGPGRLGFGEDTLFGQQLTLAGYRIAPAFDVCVSHHFDPARLTRDSFLSMAKKHGRTLAYLNRHWWHRDERLPMARLALVAARLALWRLRHPSEVRQPEGAGERELHLVQFVHYFRQVLRERRRPRAYDRCGLKKRT